jgi:biotin carboxyl carrier protein
MTSLRTVSLLVVLAAAACRRPAATHDHGHEHEHEHAASTAAISITRWTGDYELFVEFPPLEPGKSVRYNAHLTRLSDFAPVTTGRFTLRFERAGKPVSAVHAARVARPGLFTPEGKTPVAGPYEIVMEYADGAKLEVFRGGAVSVSAKPKGAPEQSGGIEFSKEAQWSIRFATALAEPRSMAREIELPATVEPAAGEQLTIAAPTSGRFFHPEQVALASGRRIERGDVLGTLAASAGGEDLAGLELAVEQARIERRRLEQELARVRPLVSQGLLPEKRRLDLENELLQRDAEQRSAERRLSRVLSPAASGGVPIRSARAGVVSEVLVGNGQPVVSGAPLLRLRGSGELWVRARFVSRGASETAHAVPTAVRMLDGTRVPLPAEARFPPSP